jgi:hypothetical protein
LSLDYLMLLITNMLVLVKADLYVFIDRLIKKRRFSGYLHFKHVPGVARVYILLIFLCMRPIYFFFKKNFGDKPISPESNF